MCSTPKFTIPHPRRYDRKTAILLKFLRFGAGVFMTLNFVFLWAVPIMSQGLLWKHLLKPIFQPIYVLVDENKLLRSFAATYVYSKPQYADFFAISIITLIVSLSSITLVIYWQLSTGSLPWFVILFHYYCWVGFGGRIMGAAYALAHKEGHNHSMYKQSFKKIFTGHIFENMLGCFFGNVPWNFTTSHIFIHHRVDGGVGDTFYLWDLDRSSWSDFMLYLWRVLLHTSGYSSIVYFNENGFHTKAKLLKDGVVMYWLVAVCLLCITRSFSFVFFIYIQPFLCMTFFLAFINIGFHGFLEFDENGKHIPEIDATTIIEGDDDYFGEDDHMAHHYNTSVYFRDLPAHQATKIEKFKKVKASVFRKVSILELSALIVFRCWDRLADFYVDYTNSMSKKEIIEMLIRRAKFKEMKYDLDDCSDEPMVLTGVTKADVAVHTNDVKKEHEE